MHFSEGFKIMQNHCNGRFWGWPTIVYVKPHQVAYNFKGLWKTWWLVKTRTFCHNSKQNGTYLKFTPNLKQAPFSFEFRYNLGISYFETSWHLARTWPGRASTEQSKVKITYCQASMCGIPGLWPQKAVSPLGI